MLPILRSLGSSTFISAPPPLSPSFAIVRRKVMSAVRVTQTAIDFTRITGTYTRPRLFNGLLHPISAYAIMRKRNERFMRGRNQKLIRVVVAAAPPRRLPDHQLQSFRFTPSSLTKGAVPPFVRNWGERRKWATNGRIWEFCPPPSSPAVLMAPLAD